MNVLITGASGGIGSQCVKLFASRKDVQVIAVSRSVDLLEKLKKECQQNFQSEIHILGIDFHKPSFQQEVTTYIREKNIELNVLINNAGMLINKPFAEQNQIDMKEQMHINLEAPALLIQSLLPYFSKSSAHVVNIGSMGGFQGSNKFPGLSFYSASKGALAILTECLAEEYKEKGISFNCLALGSADTEMLRKAFPGYKSSMPADKMAAFIVDFALKGQDHFNGKVIPVAGLST